MQVIAHIFHPLGKLDRVNDDVIVGVTVGQEPAVVDVYVLVAVPIESQVEDPLCIRLDHLLVDVTPVVVPRVPAHRRC